MDYSFEVVKSWKNDLMSSSDQADCSQQLQHQCLCPEERNSKRQILDTHKDQDTKNTFHCFDFK